MLLYFNVIQEDTIETIDVLETKNFTSLQKFFIECARLQNDYKLSGIETFLTSYCTQIWASRPCTIFK